MIVYIFVVETATTLVPTTERQTSISSTPTEEQSGNCFFCLKEPHFDNIIRRNNCTVDRSTKYVSHVIEVAIN